MNKLKLLFLASVALALNACEKVIDIDLKNTKPVIVIEGNVIDEYVAQKVKISQTKPFTEDNSVDAVTNATITLKDVTLNKTYDFSASDAEGNYFSEKFKGMPGHVYELKVKSDNQEYAAQSTMPIKVPLDSLSITEVSFFGNTRKYLKVNFADPANYQNQYRYVIRVNNALVKGYYVDSDRFNNGKYIANTIFTDEPELKTGDTIKVEFQCIDMNIYRYFFAISQISGNGGPPTAPSNPDSNFNNGALGFFSAHTSQTNTAVIK